MIDAEKKLLQAQHRLEEAQARDRVKERKARTRRLIQEGAILEKVLPEVRTIELSPILYAGGPPENRGLSFFVPEGRTYSPPAKAGGGSPPVGQARALSEGDCVSCGSRRTMPQSGWFCCHRPRSYRKHTRFCVCEQGYSLYPCLAPTACENLPPAALSQIWVSLLRRHPFSFCEKETKTKGR